MQKDLPRCGTSRSNQSWSSCCLWPAWGWWWLKDRTRNTGQREGERRPRETVSELSCHVVLIELRKAFVAFLCTSRTCLCRKLRVRGLISNFKVTHYESNSIYKKTLSACVSIWATSAYHQKEQARLWCCDAATLITHHLKKKRQFLLFFSSYIQKYTLSRRWCHIKGPCRYFQGSYQWPFQDRSGSACQAQLIFQPVSD